MSPTVVHMLEKYSLCFLEITMISDRVVIS